MLMVQLYSIHNQNAFDDFFAALDLMQKTNLIILNRFSKWEIGPRQNFIEALLACIESVLMCGDFS